MCYAALRAHNVMSTLRASCPGHPFALLNMHPLKKEPYQIGTPDVSPFDPAAVSGLIPLRIPDHILLAGYPNIQTMLANQFCECAHVKEQYNGDICQFCLARTYPRNRTILNALNTYVAWWNFRAVVP